MKPYYDRDGISIYIGDNREVLPLIDERAAAVVTDPPYGLSFMGKGWDKGVPGVKFWQIISDAMLPGAHLLAFGGTRTYHRMAVAIEDAGYEIRDTLQWLYGSGFPKSHDVSKAIDKRAGAEREVIGRDPYYSPGRKQTIGDGEKYGKGGSEDETAWVTAPATPEAEQWQGWGTALKPAYEPVIMARKPLIGTVAANVLQHGTGAINLDACRIEAPGGLTKGGALIGSSPNPMNRERGVTENRPRASEHAAGRWPANVILDEEAAEGHEWSRFFYVAKASKRERGEGNNHPTVKPLALMRYLIQMVTPPEGIVLDPFAGSGSTLVAAAELGFRAIGIEQSEEYAEIAARRIDRAINAMRAASWGCASD